MGTAPGAEQIPANWNAFGTSLEIQVVQKKFLLRLTMEKLEGWNAPSHLEKNQF